MNKNHIKTLYYSLNPFEKLLLQQSRDEFEQSENIRFTNLESYVHHLARTVLKRQRDGEFVPRCQEEAQAGHTLIGFS